MKLFARLEKNKTFWSLFGILFFFFTLRLPSIIEPYWYGDEGIYQVIGQALNHGQLLYRDTWDNKPPLLYLVYAFVNGDQIAARILSLIAGLLSAACLFFLAKKLFQSTRVSSIVTILYSLLFATPLIEGNIANAENFMLFPIIAAGLLLYQFTSSNKAKTVKFSLFLAGLLLGIAFLFKIVALFDFAAFALFIIFIHLPKLQTKYIKKAVIKLIPLIAGFFTPLLITVLYFLTQNTLSDFIHAAFFGNIGYVGYQNKFLGIPQGLLLIKLLFLAVGVLVLFWKRTSISQATLFISLWTIFSLFNTFFSGRPYTHYVLVMLPSFCLLVGLFFAKKTYRLHWGVLAGVLIVLMLILQQFRFGVTKTINYYGNALAFITGQKELTAYQSFFDQKVPRDYQIVSFINSNTTPSDNVFIWGNDAQIYAQSHKLPPNKYTVAYHINQNQASITDTQQAIDKAQPKYIIVLDESQPLPFRVPLYIMRFTLDGATIYERNF